MPSGYEKPTSSNRRSPFTRAASIASGASTVSGISANIARTRLAPASAPCSCPVVCAIADSGPYTAPRYAMTTVRSPIVIWPRITCMPPTMRTSAVPRIVIVLTTTENSDCCQVIAMRALIVLSPAGA